MSEGIRRVVTGLDEQGRSTILFDDRISFGSAGGVKLLWQTDTLPADNSGRDDAGVEDFSILEILRSPGCSFMASQMQPGDRDGPLMHATDTLDQLVVLKGHVELFLETGSVTLGPGDCVIDRGVIHGWQVVGDEPCLLVSVVVPSAPVGAGATM